MKPEQIEKLIKRLREAEKEFNDYGATELTREEVCQILEALEANRELLRMAFKAGMRFGGNATDLNFNDFLNSNKPK